MTTPRRCFLYTGLIGETKLYWISPFCMPGSMDMAKMEYNEALWVAYILHNAVAEVVVKNNAKGAIMKPVPSG